MADGGGGTETGWGVFSGADSAQEGSGAGRPALDGPREAPSENNRHLQFGLLNPRQIS